MKIKKPSMTIGAKTKTNKPLTYIKASLILIAITFLGYHITIPAQALSPVKCNEFCNTFPEADTVELSVVNQIRQIAREHNFEWEDYLVKLADCEGLMNPFQNNAKGNSPLWSIDRGLFGINDYWHSEVSNECAYNIRCAAEWTMWRINDNYQHEWMCDPIIKDINYKFRSI